MMAAVMPRAGMSIVVPIARDVAGLVSRMTGIKAVPIIGLGVAISVTGNDHAAMTAIPTVPAVAAMTIAMMLRHRRAGCERRQQARRDQK